MSQLFFRRRNRQFFSVSRHAASLLRHKLENKTILVSAFHPPLPPLVLLYESPHLWSKKRPITKNTFSKQKQETLTPEDESLINPFFSPPTQFL